MKVLVFVEDVEPDVQYLDQGEEDEEHEGKPRGKGYSEILSFIYSFTYFQIIILYHYECKNIHTVILRHFL